MFEIVALSYEESRIEFFEALKKQHEQKLHWWKHQKPYSKGYAHCDPEIIHEKCSFHGSAINYCEDAIDALKGRTSALIHQLEEEKAALLDALRMSDLDCAYCKHANVYDQACEEADFMCSECKVLEQCPCYKCTSQDKHWEWCGLPEHAGGAENAAD